MSAANELLMPRVRRMRHEDLDAVSRIEQHSYGYPWSTGIFRDCLLAGYFCVVVEQAGEVRGYGILSIAAGEAHVLNVCIAPAFRRQGHGRLLLQHLMQQARSSRVKRMFLEVRPSNLAAINMYKRIGFETVGRRRDYYRAANNRREDALVLALTL